MLLHNRLMEKTPVLILTEPIHAGVDPGMLSASIFLYYHLNHKVDPVITFLRICNQDHICGRHFMVKKSLFCHAGNDEVNE